MATLRFTHENYIVSENPTTVIEIHSFKGDEKAKAFLANASGVVRQVDGYNVFLQSTSKYAEEVIDQATKFYSSQRVAKNESRFKPYKITTQTNATVAEESISTAAEFNVSASEPEQESTEELPTQFDTASEETQAE